MTWQLEPDWPETRLERTASELWKRIDPRRPYRSQGKHWLGDPCDLLLKADVYSVGYLRRPTRLFAPHDIVLVRFTNGQAERCEASGWSTKVNAFVVRLYLPYARHEQRWSRDVDGRMLDHYTQRRDRATVALVDGFYDELPGELRVKPWFDPDVRRYAVERLRVAHSGSPLGTATRGAIP
jgi:hypothetical protein